MWRVYIDGKNLPCSPPRYNKKADASGENSISFGCSSCRVEFTDVSQSHSFIYTHIIYIYIGDHYGKVNQTLIDIDDYKDISYL